MARNLNDLANSLDTYVKTIDKKASEKAVKIAMIGLEVLYWRTPVDTTKAVSNWVVSLDNPDFKVIDPYVPGFLGYTASASIAVAKSQAESTLSNKKPGQTIYITNNTEYIRGLNSGTSKQDPGGFVEAAAMIMRKSLNN